MHWDVFLKNVLFPPAVLGHDHRLREVGALDEPKRPTSAHSADFARRENTRGIAVGMIRAMPLAAAHKALASMLAPLRVTF